MKPDSCTDNPAGDCGLNREESAEGWWAMPHSPAVNQGIDNAWLKGLGMYFMKDDSEKIRERCFNRRVPNGMHGGVRGRLAD